MRLVQQCAVLPSCQRTLRLLLAPAGATLAAAAVVGMAVDKLMGDRPGGEAAEA